MPRFSFVVCFCFAPTESNAHETFKTSGEFWVPPMCESSSRMMCGVSWVMKAQELVRYFQGVGLGRTEQFSSIKWQRNQKPSMDTGCAQGPQFLVLSLDTESLTESATILMIWPETPRLPVLSLSLHKMLPLPEHCSSENLRFSQVRNFLSSGDMTLQMEKRHL